MQNSFRKFWLLASVAAVLLCASLAFGQGIVTGSISGTVQDPQGALISGAKITATHLATNREYTAESTSAGAISVRSLPPGAYRVRVESTQFRTYESNNVLVVVGSDTSLGAVKLELGAST